MFMTLLWPQIFAIGLQRPSLGSSKNGWRVSGWCGGGDILVPYTT